MKSAPGCENVGADAAYASSCHLPVAAISLQLEQKDTHGEARGRKDVKNEGRSHDVYENKGSDDKMSCQSMDISRILRPILQKIASLFRQLALTCG